MDFPTLPCEIKELIFSYLEPEDLWNCLSVCRDWRILANSRRTWKKICADRNLDSAVFEPGESKNFSLCKYAIIWKCNYETCVRWQNNTSFMQLIPFDVSEEQACTRIFVFKKKMALISDKIELYTFTNKSRTSESIPLPFVPHAVTMNNKYLVCTYGNIVLVHAKDGTFKVLCAIALTENSPLEIRTEKVRSFIEVKRKLGPYIKTEALVAEYLWISCLDTHSQFLNIINLKDLTVTKTNVVSKLLSVTKHKVIVSTLENIQVFSFSGQHLFTLNFRSIFRATDNFIVTFPKQGDTAKVWDMEGTFVQSLGDLLLFKLDPKRHLVYSCHYIPENSSDCQLSAVSLKTGALAWSKVINEVKISEIDDMFLVCEKFLIVDVYVNTPAPHFHFGFIFDLDNKTLLYKAVLKGFTMFVSNHLWVQKRPNDLIVNIY